MLKADPQRLALCTLVTEKSVILKLTKIAVCKVNLQHVMITPTCSSDNRGLVVDYTLGFGP